MCCQATDVAGCHRYGGLLPFSFLFPVWLDAYRLGPRVYLFLRFNKFYFRLGCFIELKRNVVDVSFLSLADNLWKFDFPCWTFKVRE